MKYVHLILTSMLTVGILTSAFAEDKGLPVFADNFDAVGTFAENWVSKNCKSEDGVVKIPSMANMHWRGTMPAEFVAEADISVVRAASAPDNRPQVWGGFMIDGFHFSMQPGNTTFCVWKLATDAHSNGKYVKLPNVSTGDFVHLRLVRKLMSGGVKYCYYVNDVPAGDFLSPNAEPAQLSLYTYHTDLTVDNFALYAVRHDEDSPNTIINSGFEYVEDDTPTHFGFMGTFDFVNYPWDKFRSDYLGRYKVDTAEKHSGNQSLRVKVNGASKNLLFRPWNPGVVKGMAGVFSVWMRSNTDGLMVNLSLDPKLIDKVSDGARKVDVGREWKRYEVTRAELNGKGIYSPITISVAEPSKYDAFLWVDDLQFEIVPLPEGGFDKEKTYATEYKPSEFDRNRFENHEELPPNAELCVNKLPEGIKPSVDLDSWKDAAWKFEDFRVGTEHPDRKTEAYLACDNDNLYLGFRNFGEPAEGLDAPRLNGRDLACYCANGIELFFKPNPEEESFHLAMSANGDQFDLHANDMKWDGKWTVSAKANEAAVSVDYLVTVPFSDLAPWGLAPTWRVNLCRNDLKEKGKEQYIATGVTKNPNFRLEERWNTMTLPADVISRYATSRQQTEKVRESVLGRLDFYMNEEFAQWRVTDTNGIVTIAKMPLAEIPMGTNSVTFTANEKKYTDTVVKLPYRKGATQINRWTRSIVHDGRNELFTGIGIGGTGYLGYSKDGNPFPGMFDMLKAEGFRHFLFMASSRTPRMAEAKACLEESEKRGLLCAFWSDYRIWNYNDNLEIEIKRPYDDVTLEEMVELTRQHSNIVTHLVIDEPELYKKSEWTRAWLENLKKFYPYSPVQMNNTVMGIPSNFADLKTDILMLDDYITNNEGRTVESVVKAVDIMQTVPGGKPCWYFVIGMNMSMHYKCPSYAEQVAQSWGSICAGCTGVSWYFELPTVEGSYRAMVDVNREAQALAPVILSEELCDRTTCDQPKTKVRHMTRTLDGSWYILTCNIDGKPLSATYTLPASAPKNGTVEVLFENRTLKLEDGVFEDDYPAHFRHLYKIKGL